MKERAYKKREKFPRLFYSLREVADMLGLTSTASLYDCVYLPKDHPHYIPTVSIPIHRGVLRIPAWWIKEQIEQQIGTCGALPDVKSATPAHRGGRPRKNLTATEGDGVVMAGDDSNSPTGDVQ